MQSGSIYIGNLYVAMALCPSDFSVRLSWSTVYEHNI